MHDMSANLIKLTSPPNKQKEAKIDRGVIGKRKGISKSRKGSERVIGGEYNKNVSKLYNETHHYV